MGNKHAFRAFRLADMDLGVLVIWFCPFRLDTHSWHTPICGLHLVVSVCSGI
jgi:hypothetical protein